MLVTNSPRLNLVCLVFLFSCYLSVASASLHLFAYSLSSRLSLIRLSLTSLSLAAFISFFTNHYLPFSRIFPLVCYSSAAFVSLHLFTCSLSSRLPLIRRSLISLSLTAFISFSDNHYLPISSATKCRSCGVKSFVVSMG